MSVEGVIGRFAPSRTPPGALEAIDDNLWVADGAEVSFYGFPYPTRCVIVRLRDGGLWVWSPIKAPPSLFREIDLLGPVRHLVSPNKLHHLFLQDWLAVFPEARLWGPRSTVRKRRDLVFEEPLTQTSPVAWRGEIDQAWFRGSFVMDEIVFFHRASKTVIVADLIEAFSETYLKRRWRLWQRILARLDGITETSPHAPLEWRLSFTDRTPARAARARTLAWRAERVILAHGSWPRAEGHDFLERAFDWMGP